MKQSAGILLYKFDAGSLFFFLVHPGGPYFRYKDKSWWTIPKGELMPGEAPLDCALREMKEETGFTPLGPFTKLNPIVQKGGKIVIAWACEGDFDATTLKCNDFEIEWPPRSGKMQLFPEIDKAGWFDYDEAIQMINERQQALITEAVQLVQ